jgi:hypothetical protein
MNIGRFNICDFLKKNMSISYSYGNMKISKLSDYGSVLCRLAWQSQLKEDLIGGLMISVLSSSAVDHGFERRSGQTKDFKIGICCFSAKHAALRRMNKDWLARNQNNVSKWSDMFIHGLLF